MKIAEYIYSARTGGLKGRGVYILRADRKCWKFKWLPDGRC